VNWQITAAVIAAVSAIGALLSAIGAFLSAARTRGAAEAALAFQMRQAYGAPEMARALEVLRWWAEEAGDDFATKWSGRWHAGVKPAREVEDARRLVASYFETAIDLHDAKMISESTLRLVAGVSGLHAVRDYILPLSLEVNTRADLSKFHRLFMICGIETLPIPTRPGFGSLK
jgi:hypothetical protein